MSDIVVSKPADLPARSMLDVMITHHNVIQGTDEWLELRRGMLTASEMHLIITPALKIAANDKERAHLYELLAQRISGYVEPRFVTDAMLRGHVDEIEALRIYSTVRGPVTKCGFIINHDVRGHGIRIGYSPDALVGDDGLAECKSHRQGIHVEALLLGIIDPVHALQCQTGMIVSGRSWVDLLTYCGGLPMRIARIHPIPEVQDIIIAAAVGFEERLATLRERYAGLIKSPNLIPTARIIEQEMHL